MASSKQSGRTRRSGASTPFELVRATFDTARCPVFDGFTSRRPHWSTPYQPTLFGSAARPVLVSWATPAEVPKPAGKVAGIGGSVSIGTATGLRRYITGGVPLDAGDFRNIMADGQGPREEEAIILHEFGHVVGLAHVHDPNELMNADNLGLTGYGPGDLEGPSLEGRGHCL